MNDKLIVAIDVENFFEAKKLIEILDEEVAFFKVGLELMASGDYFKIIELLAKKKQKNFCRFKNF
ncbi:MAG: orotidine 5'-phosphate decarboxylase / HUMPS family protein [Alphaproteobacteria bacterium]